MSSSLATSYRFPKVDYPAAWHYGPFGTLLPYPKETINLAASFKPLSYGVPKIHYRKDDQLITKTNLLIYLMELGLDSDCHFSSCHYLVP